VFVTDNDMLNYKSVSECIRFVTDVCLLFILQNYHVPRVRTKLGERAFSYAGPVVWNNLPVYIRAEPDITRFKNILKTYLHSHLI